MNRLETPCSHTTRASAAHAIHRLTVFAVLYLACADASHAELARIIGEEYRNASAVVAPFGAACNIYKPETSEADAKQLYFTHFFVVKGKRTPNGLTVPDVIVTNGTEVHVTLLVSPPSLLKQIATFVRDEETTNPIDPRFRTVTASSLIAAPFLRYSIDQQYGNVFQSVNQDLEALPGRITLVARFSAGSDAEAYAKDLQSGKQVALFKVAVTLNARTRSATSSAEARGLRAKETDAVKELTGKGSSLSVSTADNSSLFSVGQLSVTRAQRSNFIGRLADEISISLDVQSPDQRTALEQQMNRFIDRLFPGTVSIPLNAQFETELGHISAYSFDPADLKPSEIHKLTADIKHFFQSDEQEKLHISASASASLLGVGSGSVSGNYDRETLKKLMEDKGWRFEQEGTHFIPKSLDVSVVDTTALKQDFTFRMSLTQSAMGQITFSGYPATNLAYAEDDAGRPPAPALPIGTIIPFAGKAIPEGWLECDGTERDAIEFPGLSQLLMSTFGEASPGKFRLPDMRGRTAIGSGTYSNVAEGAQERPVGVTLGTASLQLSGEHLPNHTHIVSGATGGQANDFCCLGPRSLPDTNGHNHSHSVNLTSQGVNIVPGAQGARFSILPPSLVLKFIIRY